MSIPRASLAFVLITSWILQVEPLGGQAVVQSGHFKTSDGIELHYLEAGPGPLMVFVPGWTMPAEVWSDQVEYFASTHHVVAFDPREQGRSEKPSWGYHPVRRAQDIDELLTHLKAGPAVVVGWSLGAQEVLLQTHEFGTEAVRAVVLVDHPILYDWARLAPRFEELQLNRKEWTRSFLEATHFRPQSSGYFDDLTRAALSTPTNAAAVMIANLILMEESDLRPALTALNRPLLYIVLKARSDQIELVRSLRPDATIMVFEDAGHALFMDKPEAFNRGLEAFLDTLPNR